MSVFKRISAALTVFSITAACTACGSNTTTAMTIDGYAVPAGVYLYYLNSSYSNALSQLSAKDETLDMEDTEMIKSLYLEDKDIRTWIEDKATELCTDFVTTEKKFEELELELDEETKEEISGMLEYYWSYYADSMESIGISEDSFRKVMTSSYKSEAIFDYYYDIGAVEGVTEEALQDYYAENNIRTQYIKFDLHDAEGNVLDDAGKADIVKLIHTYQNRAEQAYQDGGAEAVMTEMNLIQEDYTYYMTSVSEEAAGVTGEELTTTTARATTAQTTTTTAEATGADESEATDAELAETTEPVAEAETTETTETATTDTEISGDSENPEDSGNAENAEDSENSGDSEDSENSGEETETETVSYANESIISIIQPDDEDEEETEETEITYTPSEKTYQQLLAMDAADYGKVYLVEEDETYYLITRYAIRDRMTEADLWSENTIYNVRLSMYSDAFEEKMEDWSAVLQTEKNTAAFHRYDPFKFHT